MMLRFCLKPICCISQVRTGYKAIAIGNTEDRRKIVSKICFFSKRCPEETRREKTTKKEKGSQGVAAKRISCDLLPPFVQSHKSILQGKYTEKVSNC